MESNQERGAVLILSVLQILTSEHPSFLRVSLVAALSGALGTWQLSLLDGWFASLISVVLIVLALLLVLEGARFGLTFARVYSGWISTIAILAGLAICYGIARLFEHWGLLPLHRTAFWSMLIWFGFVLGVFQFSPPEDGGAEGPNSRRKSN